LGESVVMGFVGSAIGVAAGLLVARGIAASVGALVSTAFGVNQETGDISISAGLIASAVGIGIATSLVAALIPSHAVSRVEPVQTLQKGKYQTLSRGEHRARVILALICAAASV